MANPVVVDFDPAAAGHRKRWTPDQRACYRLWCRSFVLAPEETWGASHRREVAGWPSGRLEDARISALLYKGDEVDSRVLHWKGTFRDRTRPIGRWVGDFNEFWEGFFKPGVFEGYTPDTVSLDQYCLARFRKSAPYIRWVRELIARDETTWSDEEREELDQDGPEGLAGGALIAGLVLAGKVDSPDVIAWIDEFHSIALDFARQERWGHGPDAEDLVQEFWARCFDGLPGRFGKYRLENGTLTGFLFACFRNDFYRIGHALALVRRRTESLDDPNHALHTMTSSAPTPEARMRAAQIRDRLELELERCSARVGVGSRVLFQLLTHERGGEEVASELGIAEGTLRVRIFRARRALKAFLERQGL